MINIIFVLSTKDVVLDAFTTFGEAYDTILRIERAKNRKITITEVNHPVFKVPVFQLPFVRRVKYHVTDLEHYDTNTYTITRITQLKEEAKEEAAE